MSIKKIKGFDKNIYLLFDLDIISSDKLKQAIQMKKKGPIIIEPDTDMVRIACESLVSSIISTQDLCIKSKSKMELTFTVEKDSDINNIIRGKINNLRNISDEVLEKIESNNIRYMELEFVLDEPRKSYLLYIFINRDKYLGIPIYIINVCGSSLYSIVTIKEDFYTAIDGWIGKIYDDFRLESSDPAIMINYYAILETENLFKEEL